MRSSLCSSAGSAGCGGGERESMVDMGSSEALFTFVFSRWTDGDGVLSCCTGGCMEASDASGCALRVKSPKTMVIEREKGCEGDLDDGSEAKWSHRPRWWFLSHACTKRVPLMELRGFVP